MQATEAVNTEALHNGARPATASSSASSAVREPAANSGASANGKLRQGPPPAACGVGMAADVTDGSSANAAAMVHPCWSAGLVTVRVLDLSGCNSLDTSGLKQLLQSLPQPCNLEELHLSAIASVRPETLGTIVETCPRLQRAYLQELPHVTNDALCRLLEGCTHMRALLVDGCTGLTDGFASHVAERCASESLPGPVAVDLTVPLSPPKWPPHLATISLLRCSRVTEAAVSVLADAVLQSTCALTQFLVAHEDDSQLLTNTMHVGTSRLDRLRVLQLRTQMKLRLIANA